MSKTTAPPTLSNHRYHRQIDRVAPPLLLPKAVQVNNRQLARPRKAVLVPHQKAAVQTHRLKLAHPLRKAVQASNRQIARLRKAVQAYNRLQLAHPRKAAQANNRLFSQLQVAQANNHLLRPFLVAILYKNIWQMRFIVLIKQGVLIVH